MHRLRRAGNLRPLPIEFSDQSSFQTDASQRDVESLRRQLRELSVVAEVHRSIAPQPSLEQLLAQIIDKVAELLNVEKAGVMLYDPERNELVLQRPAFGVGDDIISTYHVPLNGRGNAITVFLTGEPYITNDSFNDPRMWQESVRLFDARSVMTVPLTVENECIGVIHVCNKRGGAFDQNDLQLLRLLAAHLAALIENARVHEGERQRIRELERLNVVIQGQRDKLERAATIHERLTQMVLLEGGVEGIARTLASLVENPVAVEDKFFSLVSYAPYPISTKSGELGLTEFEGTPLPVLEHPQFKEKMRLIVRDNHPVRIPAYPQYGLPWARTIAAITVGKNVLSYVSIFEKNRTLGDLDLVAAEHATTVFALELQKQKAAFEVEQRLKGDFVDDLLSGNYESTEAIFRRAAFLDYDLSGPHLLMVVEGDRCASRVGDRSCDERKSVYVRKKLFELVYDVIAERSPGSLVVSKSNTMIVLLNPADESRRARVEGPLDPKQLAGDIKERLARHLVQQSVSIAISGQCRRPEDYRRFYQVARKSLDIVRAFNQRDRVIHCDKLGVYQLLLQIEDKSELKEFVDQLIGPLINYDRNHNSSLLEALESYLQNDCNLQKTARVSYVHVSTLKYRLQRIEEIAKVDLSDAEARLGLHLGLKVWRLINQ